MGLEDNINKLLAGSKPRKMAMDKARRIEDALRREDEYALREFGLQGYLFFHVGQQRWSLAPEYEQAYYEALQKIARAARAKAASQRTRASIYSGLGMKRTRSGGWE